MARTAASGRPSAYAQEKLREMLGRWNGDLGPAVAQVAPVVWPGLPLPQAVATSANSVSRTEDLTEGNIRAIGYYQIPDSTYNRLRCDSVVQQALGGRCADSGWQSDVPGQAAVGLYDRRRDGEMYSGSPISSQWTWAVGEMSYVMGSGSARNLINRYASQLAALPDEQKFAGLILMATPSASRNEARMMVRTWQRLKTGEVLANALGQPTGWYYVPISDAENYEAALSAKYYGGEGPAVLNGQLVAYESGFSWGTVALVTLGVVVLSAGAWTAYRAYNQQPLLPEWASKLGKKKRW